MQAVGNVLTIGGIVVTLVAYFGQHSGVSLADLEPGLVKRWRTGRSWLRRKLGLSEGAVVQVGTARGIAISGGSAVAWSWSPVAPDDDLAVRVAKLERNLDQVRTNFSELRELDIKHFRSVTDALATRVIELRTMVNERDQQQRRETTTSMRWEVRGLLITLVGAGLSVLG
jgi:hypothetical protein